MPLSDPSSPSFATRQLMLRVRADLEARRHKYLGSTHWIIKDPVGMRYFRFQEEEYALLRMLDGQTNLASIQQEFEQRFAPRKLRLASLQQFIARLQTAGLLLMDQPGQGRKLQVLDQETRQRTRRAALTNIFAIRFPGFDPDRLLGKLHRYVGWFFTVPCVALVLLLAFAAISTVVINLESFSARLPAAQLFFGPSNLHWLILSMIFCKILHEFGHGLACKHFGGECHSMGAMLLFFAPAMYCDVSDSWLLPNKWQRMAIGAAGM
jgi:putative peptide zinc metalloprotease protein